MDKLFFYFPVPFVTITIRSFNPFHVYNNQIEEIDDHSSDYTSSKHQPASERLTNEFDLVSINEKQNNTTITMEFNEQDPLIYTPISFYTKLKEIMVKIYTPPVYY
ncbi:hypothetical protein [Alkalihalobacterium sp. APHAB7]|uniref:hypothetical protein n=1 Tax=Alkalihalobacterium sp. APHAB7 TaxID=3402081 RepID=UPI003AABDA33